MLGRELSAVEDNTVIKTNVFNRIFLKTFGFWDIATRIRWFYLSRTLRGLSFKNMVRVLDAGCGLGIYSLYLAKKSSCFYVIGIDIDEKHVKMCRRIQIKSGIANLQFFRDNILDCSFAVKFDVIICIDVLEHIEQDIAALDNFFSLLKEGGYFVLHVPLRLQRRFFKRFKDYAQPDHVREGYELEDLRRMLKEVNFKIIKEIYTFKWPGALAWEIGEIFFAYKPIYPLVFPLLLLLGYFDSLLSGIGKSNCVMFVATANK